MVLKNIILTMAIANICLLLLYMFNWEFGDELWTFVVFIIGLILFTSITLYALYILIFKKEYQAILILTISVMLFVLPLKKYYMTLEYQFNKEKREKIVNLYKNKKLMASKEVLFKKIQGYKLPKEYESISKDNKKIVYAYKDCILFPIFHHVQIILYCEKPHIFLEIHNYKNMLQFNKHWYWMAEKTSSEKNRGQKIKK